MTNGTTSAQAVTFMEQAANLVSGPRADSYGDFADQMSGLAQAFNGIKGGNVLAPQDIALLLMLLKIRRLDTGWDRDSAVDIIGYAGLTGAAFTADE